MESITVLYIILAAIVALGLAVLSYYKKGKQKDSVNWLLGGLRLLGVFGILLLLINPQFSKFTYTLVKPNLVVLTDNSTSIAPYGTEVKSLVGSIVNSDEIKNKFNIDSYSFGSDVAVYDSLDFTDTKTNIQKSLATLDEVYARQETVFILISDGNQTIGQDYSFFTPDKKTTILPVVVGDTTKFNDISVGPILTNKYAFLKNKFPLETYVSYQGTNNVNATVTISMNGSTVYKENLKLGPDQNYRAINTQIDANSIGFKTIQVQVTSLPEERNTVNNKRSTTIEVIDEKTNIAIISQLLHPDLGTLKKSIESNEQRQVSILKPNASASELEEVDLFIFYQPDSRFKNSMELAKKKNASAFIITGTHTDYNFLNGAQSAFVIENGYPTQEVFGILNGAFANYDISSFDLTNFPPLDSDAGPILFNTQNKALLGTQIKGLDIQKPLWTVFDDNSRKQALLLGENLWKWRVQTSRNTGEFTNFDDFIGNLVRYLTSTKNKSRLNVNYEKVYEGSTNVVISATYFDEAFLFDPNAKISIQVTNKNTKKEITNPMVLKNGFFEADLSNLVPGEYDFKVIVEKESTVETGSFSISEFDLENQFVSSDAGKMQKLASNTNGTLFYSSQTDALKQKLLNDDTYVPTEVSTENVVSLIDFWALLGAISIAFALEWFIRKYNGLI
ncbi:MAG: VWA domain-containing protein [Maribacter sp.]